jgi:hypothetical protein
MRQGLRLLLALLVLCSPAVAQQQVATNIDDAGDLKVVYADFAASDFHDGMIHAAIVTLQVVNQYQCVPNPGNPPTGSIRVYCDSSTGNLTCINSTGGNCGGGGGGGGFIVGSGTAGTIPVFTGATSIGNSQATDNGTTMTYHGSGGVATGSVTYTGVPPFSESAVEGPFSTCLPIADGQDALCSINDLAPAGLWYSANGAAYVPLAPQGSSNGPIFNDQLISGGGVTWTGLLNFTVAAASYAIVSTNYTSPQTNITLAAADPTNPRQDTIIVDNTGTVSVLTGTPAGSPVAPVPNPVSQLGLTVVNVAANATTPTLNSILVYDENVGTPTEWNCTPTANFNCNSTNNPFHLTHDIEATAATAGNGATLAFSSTVNLATYSTLSFNVRNKASWPAAKTVSICFMNSTTVVGTCIGFKNGIFGFNQANVTSYQQIVIPLSAFALTGVVDRVRFQVAGGGGTIGFYTDWIQIQSGLVGNGGGGNFQLQINGTATQLTANLVDNASVTFAQTTTNGVTTVKATAVGAPPSGTAGGDLSGSYPNPVVNQVEGAAIPTSALAVGTNGSKQLIASALQGNGTKVQASTGSTTTNNCVKFDANGNTVDAGAACGTGSGSLSGMTATQVPIAATATTVTSSKAIQGTDTNLLSSGTVSGTGTALCTDAQGGATTSGCSGGGVTSVGLALPGIFTVSGSPVTSSGTLTGTLANENAGTVWAGPAVVPGTFATLIQTCTGSTKTTGTNQTVTATCGQNVTAGDQLIVWASENINSAAGAFTISDAAGDTFTSDNTQSNFNAIVKHAFSAIGGNTGFTAVSTAGISSTQLVLYVMEYHGVTAFDAVTFHGNNGTPNSATVTTTQANDLLLAFNLNFCTGQSNTNAAFTVEATQVPPTTNTFYYSMAMDSSAAAVGSYTASAACTGVDTMNMIHLAYKTSSTPTGPPSFRRLIASDLPTIPNFLWADDQVGQTSAITTTTMFTVGTADAPFFYRGQVNCRSVSAAAVATLNFKYTDTSGTVQTQSINDTCTSLVTTGVPNLVVYFRAQAGSVITYAVAITNTPTYDVSNRLSAQ